MGALTPYAVAALDEYPVLRRLLDDTYDAEWVLQPVQLPNGHPMLAVWRVWSVTGYSDAVTILNLWVPITPSIGIDLRTSRP